MAMVGHMRFVYVVLPLLAFRFVWGLIGGHWSRFWRFIYPPSTVLRYLRGHGRSDEHLDVGHNPLGAFSVFALLSLLAGRGGTRPFSAGRSPTTRPPVKSVPRA